jgi:hypothetical protein
MSSSPRGPACAGCVREVLRVVDLARDEVAPFVDPGKEALEQARLPDDRRRPCRSPRPRAGRSRPGLDERLDRTRRVGRKM